LRLTFIEEIDKVIRDHKRMPELRIAQKLLASEVVSMIHGDNALQDVKSVSEAFFSFPISVLTKMTEQAFLDHFKHTTIREISWDPRLTVTGLT
jgi:tyrosyl-tRNA synthetase